MIALKTMTMHKESLPCVSLPFPVSVLALQDGSTLTLRDGTTVSVPEGASLFSRKHE